jgi:hypothetical protein
MTLFAAISVEVEAKRIRTGVLPVQTKQWKVMFQAVVTRFPGYEWSSSRMNMKSAELV